MYFWTTFKDRNPGTIEAESIEAAKKLAAQFGHLESIAGLPYPANPCLMKINCPPFCYTPTQCIGRSSCPKSYACSE